MTFPSATALRTFDSAARCGSFKAAAEDLGVSPTAVSHQIRGLEAQLGFALFVRGTRRIDLTDEGKRLAGATGPAFGQIGAVLAELAGEQTLTLTTTPAFATLWLVPRLRDFETAHKGIKVHVETSLHPVDLARDRRIDLAIRYGVTGSRAGTFGETFGIYAAPALADGLNHLKPAELLETRWRERALPPVSWADWFSAWGSEIISRSSIRVFEDEQHIISAALAGQGLALLSGLLVQDHVTRGWLVPVAPNKTLPGLGYTLHTHETKRELRKNRLFCSWLTEQLTASNRVWS
ncbi:LysR family transcriptional regulator [Roseibium polysiphoniae]|uniref:LysR family transcriptional regulator n=1 Tax=Roseibium polysiphoniae TaxID=2571221 RepID=A0A944CDB8_9HYPH|nr:LysR family transcriptional regulator [Roseibium polysiphoniae]MBS8261296.1 LysR family transcriptional regulator [Roseibium polysiphoniae]